MVPELRKICLIVLATCLAGALLGAGLDLGPAYGFLPES